MTGQSTYSKTPIPAQPVCPINKLPVGMVFAYFAPHLVNLAARFTRVLDDVMKCDQAARPHQGFIHLESARTP